MKELCILKRMRQDMIAVLSYCKGYYKEDGENYFPLPQSSIQGSEFKPQQGRIRLNLRKNMFAIREVGQ